MGRFLSIFSIFLHRGHKFFTAMVSLFFLIQQLVFRHDLQICRRVSIEDHIGIEGWTIVDQIPSLVGAQYLMYLISEAERGPLSSRISDRQIDPFNTE